jgi:hypothetical protein
MTKKKLPRISDEALRSAIGGDGNYYKIVLKDAVTTPPPPPSTN